jgi:hypothetical protein
VRATVIVLSKVPGAAPVKTRLVPALGEAGARALFVEMMRATLDLARRFDPLPTVAFSPPDADPARGLPGLGPCRFEPTRGADGARCLEDALQRAFRGTPLVALGGDAPDLPVERVEAALAALSHRGAALVPTGDGGFSCLALARPVPGLAAGFRYGAADAFSSLTAFLADRGLRPVTLESWPDVDTPEDLEAWRRRARRQLVRDR